MAIAYPLALPTVTGFKNWTIRPNFIIGQSQGEFSGIIKSAKHDGEWFSGVFTLPKMPVADAEEWVSWLTALEGGHRHFLIGDPGRSVPRGLGTNGATPGINGASQIGRTINTNFWNNGQLCLKQGDYIEIGSGSTLRLYKQIGGDVTVHVSNGTATLELFPRVATAWADTTLLRTATPEGNWMLLGNPEWDVDLLTNYGASFAARTVI